MQIQQLNFEHELTFCLESAFVSKELSPDGKTLITGGWDDRAIKFWDIKTGNLIRSWLAAPVSPYRGENHIPALAISPDMTTIVAGGRLLKSWNWETGKQIRTFKGSTNWTGYTKISADSTILLTESGSGIEPKIILWDLRQGKKIHTKIGTITVKWVLSPDNTTVVGEDSFDKSIKIWDRKNLKELRKLDNNCAIRTNELTFSQDGKLIAGSGFDGIIIWEYASGEQIKKVEKFNNVKFTKHLDVVRNSVFCKDAKILLSAGTDGLIQCWNIDTGINVGTLRGNYDVHSILISQDCQTLTGFGKNDANQLTVDVWKVL